MPASVVLTFLLVACDGGQEPEPVTQPITAEAQPKPAPAPKEDGITPVPFKAPDIPGFVFPLGQATIDKWTQEHDTKAMGAHAWGIWTGLNAETSHHYNERKLRVFETWHSPDDLVCSDADPAKCSKKPLTLRSPGQLTNGNSFGVTVGYDPSLVDYVEDNALLDKATLDQRQQDAPNIGRIVLPDTSIATKPTYSVFTPDNSLLKVPVWPGPREELHGKDQGSTTWTDCVWVDVSDTTPANGPFPTAPCKGDPPDQKVPIGAFVHFQLDADAAERAEIEAASDGDYALLVAMHVSSRESKEELGRWTWQTFWWSPDATQPQAPSSAEMAALRPPALIADKAAANYAGCTAYQMLDPVQPPTGGANAGKPVYCYNPWLEANFTTWQVPFDKDASWTYAGQEYQPQAGVESNCMSCHLQAAWSGSGFSQQPAKEGDKPAEGAPTCGDQFCYDAARYIDYNASYFQGGLTTDALWSIPDTVAGN